MPCRPALLPLLLPASVVAALLVALGHYQLAFLAGAAAVVSSLVALLAIRGRVERQLRALTDSTRRRAEGAPPGRAAPEDRSEGMASLEGAIDSLHVRLAAQNAAKTQEAHSLTAVLDGMAEGIWVTDVHGTVVRHNDALRRMLNTAGGAVGQRPLALLKHEALNDAVIRACREGASTSLELTLEGLFPRTLAIRVAPLGLELPGSAAVFHDVTELRRLEKVRKDFVANVSHELRTPITAIRGYAETLQSGALADPAVAPQMVEIIHRQSERLSELVEDLLELSRLESREVKLRSVEVSLEDAATRASETVRPKAASKRIHLELDVPSHLRVRGDERAVEQVLLNLLDNAVKYTPEGGIVALRGEAASGGCVVKVRDTGLGIEAKHLSRIFERFYRVDKGRSRDMGGTGLGLSIVKHLVVAMDGEIKVDSRPNEGTTFTIFLPAAAHEVAASG